MSSLLARIITWFEGATDKHPTQVYSWLPNRWPSYAYSSDTYAKYVFFKNTFRNTGYLRSSWIKLNSYFRQKTIHGVRDLICTCSLGIGIWFFTFRMDFEPRGWPPQPQIFSSSSTKITKKMHNFELQFWHVGGCAGYPLSSKSILKVKTQIL